MPHRGLIHDAQIKRFVNSVLAGVAIENEQIEASFRRVCAELC